ncbi:MAG TPA: ribonuclease HII [Patescibacteria group bacterium]
MPPTNLTYPDLSFEKPLWDSGYNLIAGIDEVGRGAFAGPVVAAAVILPRNFNIPSGLNDSKKVKPNLRKKLAEQIKMQALDYCISEISVANINKYGIGKATQMAFRKCLKGLKKAEYLLIDAFYIKQVNRKNQKPIIKGDEKSATIAAASIIAKVYRDQIMKKLAKKYPNYKWSKNKGYGTKDHRTAIAKFGLTRHHRKSFNIIVDSR